MPISPEVQEFVDAAVSSMKRADIVNASMMAKNAQTFLSSAWQYVEATPSLSSAFEAAARAVREFDTSFRSSSSFGFTDRERDAQSSAVAAIEFFDDQLQGARPNDFAKALAMDW